MTAYLMNWACVILVSCHWATNRSGVGMSPRLEQKWNRHSLQVHGMISCTLFRYLFRYSGLTACRKKPVGCLVLTEYILARNSATNGPSCRGRTVGIDFLHKPPKPLFEQLA